MLLDHVRKEMPNDIDHAFDVDGDDLIELRGGDSPQWRIAVRDSGVVEDEIRCATFFVQTRNPRLHLIVRSDIHNIEIVPFRVVGPQLLDELACPPTAERRMSQRNQFVCHGSAQTPREPCNNNYLFWLFGIHSENHPTLRSVEKTIGPNVRNQPLNMIVYFTQIGL